MNLTDDNKSKNPEPSDSSWFVYIIRTKHNSLYTGITTDLTRRLAEHQAGAPKGAKNLRGKGPLQMVYSTPVASRSEASKLEVKIKKLPKARKEALVCGQLPLMTISGV